MAVKYQKMAKLDGYLLQQNGYMVLRFLSVDVGKHLDDVLDSILRALTHQEEKK